ncbi:uncharacterized protein K460DRAFT_335150 [Cucurbitaria berberidis CBS 394.84]|uniref:Uncharacterized protein n=1 Tax=Cucurbitaria berberidis CBS 394.84 TaxID=1168544 RepID=A0A9P4GN62_9PLEO|nr:uncharacterized protein K460DRAFT_335150 [Cucurbitaria berberidis CBS 394.84]KAF1848732.1 hypothetical protein K460DRAFT_335150 [Cucurbitaria berberidis CBS 394.84]
MQLPTHIAIERSNKGTTVPTSIITTSSDLRITMTIQTKSKRHAKKHCAIERPDGVIIESPRYKATSAAPRQELKFQAKPYTLNISSTSSKPKEALKCTRALDRDLANIRTHFMDCGRDGYNAPVDCGRGGYTGRSILKRIASSRAIAPCRQCNVSSLKLDRGRPTR